MISILVIHIFAVMSPGPDFALIIQKSLSSGKREGFLAAIGLSLGIAIHSTYTLMGLAQIITKSFLLYKIIIILSSLFLIYLGVKNLLVGRKKAEKQNDLHKEKSRHNSLIEGLLTNLLNPKAIVYFLGIMGPFLTNDIQSYQKIILGASVVGIGLIWFSFLAWSTGQKKIKEKIGKAQTPIIFLISLLFIVYGAHQIIEIF